MTHYILNTRPVAQSQYLTTLIESNGLVSVALPLLEIKPTPKSSWTKNCPEVPPYLIIFISANAVHYAIEDLKKSWQTLPPMLAIGPSTQQALESHGISHIHLPKRFDSEALIQHPLLQNITHKTLLLVKGQGGRNTIKEFILSKKAHLIELKVYRRDCPENLSLQIKNTWLNHSITSYLFIVLKRSIIYLIKHPSLCKKDC